MLFGFDLLKKSLRIIASGFLVVPVLAGTPDHSGHRHCRKSYPAFPVSSYLSGAAEKYDTVKPQHRPRRWPVRRPLRRRTPAWTSTPGSAMRSDTPRIYRYTNGSLSVRVYPFVNGRRNIELFDRKGNNTITFEEIRHSFSVSYDLRFRPDGSVERIAERTSPDAGIYWFTCTITVSNNNEPEWRRCSQQPQDRVELPGSNDWYWHRPSRQWKKQEVVVETITPPGGL